jgi:hypothetical protein
MKKIINAFKAIRLLFVLFLVGVIGYYGYSFYNKYVYEKETLKQISVYQRPVNDELVDIYVSISIGDGNNSKFKYALAFKKIALSCVVTASPNISLHLLGYHFILDRFKWNITQAFFYLFARYVGCSGWEHHQLYQLIASTCVDSGMWYSPSEAAVKCVRTHCRNLTLNFIVFDRLFIKVFGSCDDKCAKYKEKLCDEHLRTAKKRLLTRTEAELRTLSENGATAIVLKAPLRTPFDIDDYDKFRTGASV